MKNDPRAQPRRASRRLRDAQRQRHGHRHDRGGQSAACLRHFSRPSHRARAPGWAWRPARPSSSNPAVTSTFTARSAKARPSRFISRASNHALGCRGKTDPVRTVAARDGNLAGGRGRALRAASGSQCVESQGYEVLSASNGQDALACGPRAQRDRRFVWWSPMSSCR